ncbi:hypothetical protein ABEB36_014187 [Hypothenemus hampei]|uniref:Uncharacterized protein n=1 Tax=Hypothenemus hampei TaxID=57062 RepID=A0ABD1E3T1_HYPHA
MSPRQSSKTATPSTPGTSGVSHSLNTDDLRIILNEFRESNSKRKSLCECAIKFYGEKDTQIVKDFIRTTTIFKDAEHISDNDALIGLPAAEWWDGIYKKVNTWKEACELILKTFAPKKPNSELYFELFMGCQDNNMNTEEFICKKRAILAKLPPNRHDEETELDMIYEMLNINIRSKIARSDIISFDQLLEKASRVEALVREEKFKNSLPSY